MSRPIDAGALHNNITDIYGNKDRVVYLADILDLIDAQPTLTPQNEWVSVEERLPAKSGQYFAYTTEENMNFVEFDEDCGEFGFWKEYYQDGAYLDSEWVKADWITHWMSLPVPLDEPAADTNAVLQRALDTCGAEAQTGMVFEEMAELQKELCKWLRGIGDREHIAEEIADVEIMLDQMKLLHSCADECKSWRLRKLERLSARLNA